MMKKIKYISFLIFTLILIVGCSNDSHKLSENKTNNQEEIKEQELYINGKKEKGLKYLKM